MPLCITCNRTPVFGVETTCSSCKMAAHRSGLKPAPVAMNAGPAVLAPGTLPPGGVLALNVRRQGTLQWQAVAATLYVLKGTILEFQVVCQGATGPLAGQVRLEGANWTGLANGTGNMITVNCSANTAVVAVPWVLTVAYGGQVATANVVVFELNITAAFRDNFAGRSTTDLGICEDVDLDFTTTPAGITSAQIGGLRWQFQNNQAESERNTGLFRNAAGTGFQPNNGTASYRAPFATHGPGLMAPGYADVSIQLCVIAGVSQGLGPVKTYRIVKAVVHMTRQAGSAAHHWNPAAGPELPSAGFTGVFHFTPKNVSFSNLGFREGTGNMESDGVCAGDEHGLAHQATAQTFALTTGSTATGCLLQGGVSDNIHSAAATYDPNTLLTTNGGTRAPGTLLASKRVGGKRWPITWEYTYRDLATGNWSATFTGMQKAYHELTVYENGRAVMEKGHKGCSECTAKVAVDFGVGAAHNWP